MSYSLFNRLNHVLMNEAGDGDGGGGTPPADTPPSDAKKTDTPPQGFSQADIDKAVADAIAKNNLERDALEKGLAETKDSLLEQNKKFKAKIRDNELKQRMLDGDVEKVTKEIEARIKAEYSDKITTLSSEVENLKSESHNKSIESFVDSLNDGCGIRTELKDAKKLEILRDGEFTQDENGNILINGKNRDEFIADWLENGQNVDVWKAAPNSSGGGSRGGKSPAGQDNHATKLSSMDGGAMFAAASEMQKK